MEIEAMTIQHLDSIAENLYIEYDDFWTYSIFKTELENDNSKYFIVKKNNKILAYGGICKIYDIAHITNIVTKKNMRKSGIASLLMEKLIQVCKNDVNILSITLEVNENNKNAIILYEKYNFIKLGFRKNYYEKEKENALIMTLDMKK